MKSFYNKILIPIDGSEHADLAFRQAMGIAQHHVRRIGRLRRQAPPCASTYRMQATRPCKVWQAR